MKINDRIIICDKCGKTYDRDINAVLNILFEGIKKFVENQDKLSDVMIKRIITKIINTD